MFANVILGSDFEVWKDPWNPPGTLSDINADKNRLTSFSTAHMVKPVWWAHLPLTAPQRPEGISSPNTSNHTTAPFFSSPPSPSCHPAGRRLMTLCLPSNRLFDNKPAPSPPSLPPSFRISRRTMKTLHRCSNRKRGMWRHTHGSVRERAGRPRRLRTTNIYSW